MESNLSDVVPNDTVINSVSFSVKETTKDVFVRANVRYYVDRAMTNEDRSFLISINYDGVETNVGTGYKWVRGGDGFYYLTDTNGLPLKVNGSDKTEYMPCEDVVYNGAKSIGIRVRQRICNSKWNCKQ